MSCAAEEVVYNIHTCAVLVHSAAAAAAAVTWVRHVQRAGGVNGDGSAVRRCPTMLPLRKCSLLLILIAIITSLPVGEGNCCDDHVCLSVREHISGTTRPIFTKFLCVLPISVGRSFSGGGAIL